MKTSLLVVVFFTILVSVTCRPTMLTQFFSSVLDGDQDGTVSKEEWVEFVSTAEKQEHLLDENALRFKVLKTLGEFAFDGIDRNGDHSLSLEEFEKRFKERLDSSRRYSIERAPEQIHLSITSDPTEMVVVWVTFDYTNASVVEYGQASGLYSYMSKGITYSYEAGFFGWDGYIHKVTMTGLQPEKLYYYHVGDGDVWSPEFSFKTRPVGHKDGIRMLTFGDMGTFMPFGLVITDAMIKAQQQNPYDIALHLGDVAYAGTGSTREWQVVWDIWGRQVEPLAAHMPYMTTLGNHEKYYNFTSFKARLPMHGEESGGYENYYYSFDYAGVHVIQTCSEAYASPYAVGSPQYEWLRKDLEKANVNREKVPWIIVNGHRPMYGSTSTGGWEDIRKNIEPLLKEFNVDLFLCGHVHAYERSYPVYDFKTEIPEDPNVYVNPSYPVHVQIGTAGAFVWEKWVRPKPEWSAFREARYGFGQLEIVDRNTLHFQFFSGFVLGEGKLSDEFWIKKN